MSQETIKCIRCGEEKTTSNFTFLKDKNSYRRVCHQCRREEYRQNPTKGRERAKEWYYAHRGERLTRKKAEHQAHPERDMWKSARDRAKAHNLPFDIELEDIKVPTHCPVLGLELQAGDGAPKKNSPTLDRIIPEKGYVKGNVIVVSWLANTIKNCGTVEQIMQVAEFYKDLIESDKCKNG